MKSKKYQSGTDTVNAKLTPKEAVLNRNAAELLGRDAIKRLNAHGNMLAKRGVDLASDPAPYPSTENLEGYQMGSSDVDHEDQGESMMRAGYRFTPQDLAEMQRQRMMQGQVRRAQVMNEKPVFQFQGGTSDVKDLLADADNTFYGGGHAPAPTPTPTPKPRMNRYQYGTTSVQDYDPFNTNPLGGVPIATGSYPVTPNSLPGINAGNTGGSRYIGRRGVDMGPLYDQQGKVNPLPKGAVGSRGAFNGSSQSQDTIPTLRRPMTHVEMAADIARRNLTAVGSGGGLQTPQQPQPTLSGYHWYAGTGGVSGGNNAWSRNFWSDNTMTVEPAGSQYQTPRLGLSRADQPGIVKVPQIQYIQPGVNAPVNALSDPSVGALDTAQRSTNQFGQQVIGLSSPDAYAITGRSNTSAPVASIANSAWMDDKTGQVRQQGYGSAYGY